MTMPNERTRSLIFAGEFLESLVRTDLTPGVPDDIRGQARHILRHYPAKDEIEWLALQVERDCRYALLAPIDKYDR